MSHCIFVHRYLLSRSFLSDFILSLSVETMPRFWKRESKNLPWERIFHRGNARNENLKIRSVLKDSVANSVRERETSCRSLKSLNLVREQRFVLRKIYVDRDVLARTDRLIVPCREWVANFQVDREQKRSRETSAAQTFACKTLTLVFAPRCSQTKLRGAISITIGSSRHQDTTAVSEKTKSPEYWRRGSDTRREIAADREKDMER